MKVVFGGVRGSFPVSGPEYEKYGGDTTSILFESPSETQVVVDCGTGLGRLTPLLYANQDVHILLTHYHLDHLNGIFNLPQLSRERACVRIYGPRLQTYGPKEILSAYIRRPFWPVQLTDYPCALLFKTLEADQEDTPIKMDDFQVSFARIHHDADGAVGYRIECGGRRAIVATDIEWKESTIFEQDAFFELCGEAPDLLIFDGHFLPVVYSEYRGWGHSTWEDAVEAATKVKAKKLVITHHSPGMDDRSLEELERDVTKAFPGTILGRSGLTVEL